METDLPAEPAVLGRHAALAEPAVHAGVSAAEPAAHAVLAVHAGVTAAV